ncbi:MAG: hypothetical protein IJP92_13515 [Lachnospiraceae bacterium]|nr:hypothetical protein [Lachnospiraceae bacterium]
MRIKRTLRPIVLLCIMTVLYGCSSSGNASHGGSSAGMVESIAQQNASADEDIPVGMNAEVPGQTAPPTQLTPQDDALQTPSAPSLESGEHPTAHDDIDVDLTMLSSSMVYAEVLNIMNDPLSYVGKTIRMNGEFGLFVNEIDNLQYYACIITDATACCANGIEFVRSGDYSYPEDFPEIGEEIIVTGIFEIYEENGLKYIHLADATMEEVP